jgi:NAD(P)-dependent dehydrogenase (short-subunit alcohol dehydrogenase family)
MILEKNTLAVVLNGSSVQGITAAKNLIHQYNRVLLVGHDRTALKASKMDIAKQCPADKILYVEADLTRKAELAKFICLVKDKFGGADFIENCMEIEDAAEHASFEAALKSFEEAALNTLQVA